MHRVRLLNKDVGFDVQSDRTILEAALDIGVSYPFGCSAGSCGACKTRLVSGDVEMMDHSPMALSDAERSSGLILACRARPLTDCLIVFDDDPDAPNHTIRRVDAEVIAHETVTHDVSVVTLRSDRGFVYSPGQFATLAPAGVPARDYSMANVMGEGRYEFHVRRMQNGRTSSYIHDSLRVGDRLPIRGPFGTAYWRKRHSGPTLLVAGGTGLAPILAIAQAALATGDKAPVHLYFGVRSAKDLYYLDRLDDLAQRHSRFRWHAVLSDPDHETMEFKRGYVGAVAVRELGDLAGYKVYAAGPPIMVDSTRMEVGAHGGNLADFHSDPFYTAAEVARPPQAP
jgi:ferredoxin-NAD(P)+ reductase (naphthalene dioxygenase ferredoxin-specific)